MKPTLIDDKEVVVRGRIVRIAKLRAEFHEFVEDPDPFVATLLKSQIRADLFSFLQKVSDVGTKYKYPMQWENVAVLPIDTYDKWWKQQINDKTRNMVRKASKKGVNVVQSEYDDDFVRGIQSVHDECPIRQGKPFRHYRKDFETVKQSNASFLNQSTFIGAYLDREMIGFIKFIQHGKTASIMQIISKLAHRDKAPTNALVAKAVEICAQRGITHLQYGVWSRRTLGEFKKHHGFEHCKIPRYFIPLNLRGKVALNLKLHQNFVDLLPGAALDKYADIRARWYAFKHPMSP